MKFKSSFTIAFVLFICSKLSAQTKEVSVRTFPEANNSVIQNPPNVDGSERSVYYVQNSNNLNDNSEILNLKYYSSDSLLVLELKEQSDSLVGTQCFTSIDGNKIDCCIDQTSLHLKEISNNKFKGVMKSCYDDKIHDIQIEININELVFIFIKDDHEFISKETLFNKN